jgi:hypothetical protein
MLTDGSVTFDVHLSLLGENFVFIMVAYDIPMNSHCFQKDGARPYISNALIRVPRDVFGQRSLWNRYSAICAGIYSWLLTSPDLNPCNYFMLGYFKNSFYMKSAIQSEIVFFYIFISILLRRIKPFM